MRVAELWRYPVKSMAGERLEEIELREDGFVGDRVLHVRDAGDRLVTARTRPRLLGLRATLGGHGQPLIDGRPWPEQAAAVRAAAGEGARLVEERLFDETPLLVATDGAVEQFGIDFRRLRPNILVSGVEGMSERDWEGRRLRAGEVEIDALHLCERCVMTTFDPDTREQDPNVLVRINEDLGGLFALNCSVARPGRIALGDPVELL